MAAERVHVPFPVGVLGATGTVGQRFIKLIAAHPYFRLHALGASARSAGRPYHQAVKGRWKQTTAVPASARDLVVQECVPDRFQGCVVIFSGLDADVAGDVELAFRASEFAVFSNAKNHRRDAQIPLIVPLVNPAHFAIIPHQRSVQTPRLQRGFIVTNANCSTTGLVIPLAALEKKYGPLDAVLVSTMHMDIMDNVIPYIGGEEEKLEWETAKILGGLTQDGTSFNLRAESPLRISASCSRVPVTEGHTETVSVRFSHRPPPSPQQVRETLAEFSTEAQSLRVPSAPQHAIIVHEDNDRPQPRLDRDSQDGSCVHVGRIRQCAVLDIKFVVMSNNVAIGAATSSIMNAEIALSKKIIISPDS
ncbi:aspartate-semialdehyde dehydrogenase [Cantharellus anzutake]|uniref:aspartate-semialdehyde dehydrogenase n=1 Tax=Cantharellus anzutake TaxID=1750568 RepID=UPI001905679E|nr:aspartate-semialdehyde dehydrogenase [Cantharellus anzutake]KAF8324574.1 aspartate-semialdehyde dehydrogenase [Cantharellus anzutake]